MENQIVDLLKKLDWRLGNIQSQLAMMPSPYRVWYATAGGELCVYVRMADDPQHAIEHAKRMLGEHLHVWSIESFTFYWTLQKDGSWKQYECDYESDDEADPWDFDDPYPKNVQGPQFRRV